MRAARQGRDSQQVTLKGNYNIQLKTKTEGVGSGCYVGISIWQLLLGTTYFENYRDMYDEVRLDGFRARIIGNSAGTITLASGLSSVATAVAYDRNGITGRINKAVRGTSEVGQWTWTPEVELFRPFTVSGTTKTFSGLSELDQILSYGTCKTRNWSPGNAFSQYLSIYPKDMQEKIQYVSVDKLRSSLITGTVDTYNTTSNAPEWAVRKGFPSGLGRTPAALNWGGEIISADMSSTLQNFTDKGADFDPVMFVAVYNIPTLTSSGEQTFVFTMEYSVTCTFRGARSGALTTSPLSGAQNNLTGTLEGADAVRVESYAYPTITSNGTYNINALTVGYPEGTLTRTARVTVNVPTGGGEAADTTELSMSLTSNGTYAVGAGPYSGGAITVDVPAGGATGTEEVAAFIVNDEYVTPAMFKQATAGPAAYISRSGEYRDLIELTPGTDRWTVSFNSPGGTDRYRVQLAAGKYYYVFSTQTYDTLKILTTGGNTITVYDGGEDNAEEVDLALDSSVGVSSGLVQLDMDRNEAVDYEGCTRAEEFNWDGYSALEAGGGGWEEGEEIPVDAE